MRTHWGWITSNCMSCREPVCFLLIEKHLKEGVQCPKCHREAVSAERARRMARAEEGKEEALHGEPVGAGRNSTLLDLQ